MSDAAMNINPVRPATFASVSPIDHYGAAESTVGAVFGAHGSGYGYLMTLPPFARRARSGA